MTRTALENKKINTQKQIADRELKQKKDEFKHKKRMDIMSFFKPGAGFGKLVTKQAHNDPSWYKTYVSDLDKFTNIATFVRNGLNTYDGYLTGLFNENSETYVQNAVSGIIVYDWIPSINTARYVGADISMEAVNQILMRTKEQVLKSNSRSSVPYEAADLGMNFLASASILNAICEYERILLLAQTYEADNAYYPNVYLQALGINDPNQWLNNLPQARKNLVLLKERFNSAIVAPEGISLYKKYAYLGSLWVKDSETHPYSVFTTKCAKFFILSEDGASLEVLTPTRSTPSDYYSQISSMIQRIAENPDYVEMYADLRSAVHNLVKLDTHFDENANIEAVYDSIALEQIANIQTLPMYYTDSWNSVTILDDSMKVHQNTNGYLYQGETANDTGIKFRVFHEDEVAGNLGPCFNHIGNGKSYINFRTDNIDGNLVLDTTRPKIAYTKVGSDTDQGTETFKILDSDMACFIHGNVYTIQHTDTTNGHTSQVVSRQFGSDFVSYVANPLSAATDFLGLMSRISNFDWLSLISAYFVTGDSIWTNSTFGDVSHLVSITKSTLRDINVACGLGLMYLDTDSFKM